MSKFFSLAALVVGGVIVADILIHPAGTKIAATGINRVESPAIAGLLGQAKPKA